jgi:hypothetical protein
MMVAVTPDGWMDEATKASWFSRAKQNRLSPFADPGQCKIMQSDQHYSNLSLDLLLDQIESNAVALFTPGHHTAVLQQADQAGGPIQHANSILRALLRREAMRFPGSNVPKVSCTALHA